MLVSVYAQNDQMSNGSIGFASRDAADAGSWNGEGGQGGLGAVGSQQEPV